MTDARATHGGELWWQAERGWRSGRGTAQALRARELVQMDPLSVVARSHDLGLHSRALNYARVYDWAAEDDEAERFLMRKLVTRPGWITARGWPRSHSSGVCRPRVCGG